MEISRYIKFPLIFGLSMLISQIIPYWFFGDGLTLNRIIRPFIYGVVFGLVLQVYSDYKTRKVKPTAVESDFAPHQKKQITLLYDFQDAFDICLKSVELLNKGKIKTADKEKGYIKAKTGMNWNSWGNVIEIKLSEITENATGVEIFTRPTVRTVLIDDGEGLKQIKSLTEFFESKNEETNRKLVEAKLDIPINVNVNRPQGVKIESH